MCRLANRSDEPSIADHNYVINYYVNLTTGSACA